MQFTNTIKLALISTAFAAGTLAAQAAVATTATDAWRFEVLLDDKQIGYHDFSVFNDGPRQVLETEASFDVKFLFITAFRYRHTNTEIWNDDCLLSIDAATDNNGDTLLVNGTQQEDAFRVSRDSGEATLERCVKTFAYWNPGILEADRLLNSQTGEYEDVSVEFDGEDQVVVDGSPVDALRYRLIAGAGEIKLWYSNEPMRRWLALEAPAKGGRTLRYRPLAVPADVTSELSASR